MIIKYKNKKVHIDGMVFDSEKEYRRWCELKLLEKAGEIQNLQRQVKYCLIPGKYEYIPRISEKTGKRLADKVKCVEQECNYFADFVYEQKGETVVEDVKGYKNGTAYQLFAIKRKLMLHKFGIRIKET